MGGRLQPQTQAIEFGMRVHVTACCRTATRAQAHFSSTFGLGDHPDTLKNAGSMQVPSWAFSGIKSEMCKGKKPWYHGRVSCFLSVCCQTRDFLWPLYKGKDKCKTLLLSSPVHAGGRFSSDQSELGTSQAPCTLICLHYAQGIYLCTHCSLTYPCELFSFHCN